MFDRKVLKSRAKFVLMFSLMPSILACVIVNIVANGGLSFGTQLQGIDFAGMSDARKMMILAVFSLIVLLGIVVSIFIVAPLKVGLKHFMLNACDRKAKLEDLLYPFKTSYRHIVWVTFVKNLYVALWTIPAIITFVAGLYFIYSGLFLSITGPLSEEILGSILLGGQVSENVEFATSVLSGYALIGSFLMLLSILLLIPALIKEFQYVLVDYILAENPDTPRKEAILRSKEMMVGNKWAYVKLILSFVGWGIVATFACCGVGTLILMPYMEATYAQMYLELAGKNKDYTEFENGGVHWHFGGFEGM